MELSLSDVDTRELVESEWTTTVLGQREGLGSTLIFKTTVGYFFEIRIDCLL